MNGLKITDGDLALQGNGDVIQISGAERIAQELSCWLLEPLGSDRLYTGFGSDISDQIGTIIDSDALLAVKTEVVRVVKNYIAYQQNQIKNAKADNLTDFVNAWNKDDIISTINSISVTSGSTAVTVVVSLTTAGGSSVTVTQSS